jgi:uncharacterized protein (TIGR03435 family)
MRIMLQNLLIERLQMKVHREKREMSVYALVPGKGPAKVKPAGSGGQPDLSGSATGVKFSSQPLSRLTFLLTRRLGLPVLDETNLPGIYDYTIDISGLPGPDGNDGPGPSIFQAVQADLGLRLESKKEAIEVLVIDSVNKTPTPN